MLREWCSACGRVGPAACGEHRQGLVVGQDCDIEVVVLDRRYDLDLQRYGFHDNVGTNAELTRKEINRRRVEAMAAKREHRETMAGQVVGAIPSALFFSYKKQYGDSIIRDPRSLLKPEGLWFGD